MAVKNVEKMNIYRQLLAAFRKPTDTWTACLRVYDATNQDVMISLTTAYYHVKKYLQAGFLREVPRERPQNHAATIYVLTTAGRAHLEEHLSPLRVVEKLLSED